MIIHSGQKNDRAVVSESTTGKGLHLTNTSKCWSAERKARVSFSKVG